MTPIVVFVFVGLQAALLREAKVSVVATDAHLASASSFSSQQAAPQILPGGKNVIPYNRKRSTSHAMRVIVYG
jgi:hypothetical protein